MTEIDPETIDWSHWADEKVVSAKAACASLDRKRIAGQRRVYFMRHGECDHNMPGSDAPYTIEDSDLNEIGRNQALRCSKMLGTLVKAKSMQVDVIIASPMSRAIQTALFMQQALGQVQMEITPLICERVAFACDRGTRKSALQAKFPELDLSALTAEEWWPAAEETALWGDAKPMAIPTQAPTEEQYLQSHWLLQKRLHGFLRYLKDRPEQNILVVAHGAFNCQLLGRRTANVEVFGANWPPVSFAPEGQTVVAGQYRGANRALIQE